MTLVALARAGGIAAASRLAALSDTTSVAPEASGEAVQRSQCRCLRGGDAVGRAGQRHAGRLGGPGRIALASRLAAVSATTSVAPEPSAKPASAASDVACAAVTVLAVPLSDTLVALAIAGGIGQQVGGGVGHHQCRTGRRA